MAAKYLELENGMSRVLSKVPRSTRKWGLLLVSGLILLLVWQWQASRPGAFAFAPLPKILSELWDSIVSGDILSATAGTLATVAVGYCISGFLGVAIGVFIALSSWGRNTVEPLVDALYATPVAIFIPIVGIYLGLGFEARVAFVIIWSLSVIIINTTMGIRETSPELIEMALSFSAGRWKLLQAVILPSALRYVLVGLRLGLARAFQGAITAELLLSITNLGAFLTQAGALYNIPRLLAGILFVTLLGTLMLRGVETLEMRVLKVSGIEF